MATPGLSVWVVDDDESVRWVLEQALKQAHMIPRAFDSGRQFFQALEHDRPDVLITDIHMPDMSGLELMERLTKTEPDVPVIVITAHSDLDSAVSAYQGGAFEYLPKPFDIDEAMELVSKAARQRSRSTTQQATVKPIPRIIGQAPAMQEVFKAIGRLSRSSMTVLITGESGTGKELVARALHDNSPRANNPFVALNTSAIAAELLESELFGHEKGAFTGAVARRVGKFEEANGGTLLLDEISEMDLKLQSKLLRAIQEREIVRIGSNAAVKIDTRILATSNRNMEETVKAGKFREDLYFRLNVVKLVLPPLRDRPKDIEVLAGHFARTCAEDNGLALRRVSPEAIAALKTHNWPGNVRELENTLHRAVLLSSGDEIGPDAFDFSSSDGLGASPAQGASQVGRTVADVERDLIIDTLKHTLGNRTHAARILGISIRTLRNKLHAYVQDGLAVPAPGAGETA